MTRKQKSHIPTLWRCNKANLYILAGIFWSVNEWSLKNYSANPKGGQGWYFPSILKISLVISVHWWMIFYSLRIGFLTHCIIKMFIVTFLEGVRLFLILRYRYFRHVYEIWSDVKHHSFFIYCDPCICITTKHFLHSVMHCFTLNLLNFVKYIVSDSCKKLVMTLTCFKLLSVTHLTKQPINSVHSCNQLSN